MSEFAGDADMAELVEFFVTELQGRIDSLHQAWEGDDAAVLKRLAHQLKGAAGGYGFPTITESAAEFEDALRAEADHALLLDKFEALITLCRRASTKA